MKFTLPLQHAKYFWWGKGWGKKPWKNTDHFYYKQQWKAKRRRPIEVIEQKLPVGAKPIDPNVYIAKEFNKEFSDYESKNFDLPWPFSIRPIKGTVNDPEYKEKSALVFQRNKRLVEPIDLPLYFTDSILEPNLPEPIKNFQSQIRIEDKFIDYCRRRLNSVLNSDSALSRLPIGKEFPYMDQNPPVVYGTTINRKENNLLYTLYDLSNLWYSNFFGFNSNFILQRFSHPYCIHPVNRDDKFAILDLDCDFITLLSPIIKTASTGDIIEDTESLNKCLFDSEYKINASNKPLKSIDPISWEIAFDKKNFYNDNFEFEIPINSKIQTIFLSNNSVRMLNDEDYQGRGIIFCYGYAMKQIKQNKPITIQCLYTSPKNFKIGFVLFQLNNFDNLKHDTIRNQVWLSEPRSVLDETRETILDLVTMQSFQMNQL